MIVGVSYHAGGCECCTFSKMVVGVSYNSSDCKCCSFLTSRSDVSVLKYCNFKEYSIYISLWSPMVLQGEPLVLLCTPMLLIGRTNKSHEVVPSNCKGGSLAPQCGYLSLHV